MIIQLPVETSLNIAYGAPRIRGTRIRVQDIVSWHLRGGWSIEDITAQFGLTPAQIHAGLAYYFDHQAEIDSALEASSVMESGENLKNLINRE